MWLRSERPPWQSPLTHWQMTVLAASSAAASLAREVASDWGFKVEETAAHRHLKALPSRRGPILHSSYRAPQTGGRLRKESALPHPVLARGSSLRFELFTDLMGAVDRQGSHASPWSKLLPRLELLRRRCSRPYGG